MFNAYLYVCSMFQRRSKHLNFMFKCLWPQFYKYCKVLMKAFSVELLHFYVNVNKATSAFFHFGIKNVKFHSIFCNVHIPVTLIYMYQHVPKKSQNLSKLCIAYNIISQSIVELWCLHYAFLVNLLRFYATVNIKYYFLTRWINK